MPLSIWRYHCFGESQSKRKRTHGEARFRSSDNWKLRLCRRRGLCGGLGLFGGVFLCCLVAGLFGVLFGHELAMLSLPVQGAFLVIDLGGRVAPHQSLGLGVGDFLLRRRWSDRKSTRLHSSHLGI